METFLNGKYRKPKSTEILFWLLILFIILLYINFQAFTSIMMCLLYIPLLIWSLCRLPEIGQGEQFQHYFQATHVLKYGQDSQGRIKIGFRYFLGALSPWLHWLYGTASHGTIYFTNKRLLFQKQRGFSPGASFDVRLSEITEIQIPQFVGPKLDISERMTRFVKGKIQNEEVDALVDVASTVTDYVGSPLLIIDTFPQLAILILKLTRSGLMAVEVEQKTYVFQVWRPQRVREEVAKYLLKSESVISETQAQDVNLASKPAQPVKAPISPIATMDTSATHTQQNYEDTIAKLERLGNLKEKGLISDSEYALLKEKALRDNS